MTSKSAEEGLPRRLGEYELLRRIAIGGMGEVFLARPLSRSGFERYLAIKQLLPELSDDRRAVEMFLDEARLSCRLNHQNIAQVHDLGLEGRRPYLVMDFLEGRDLRRIMGRLATKGWPMPLAFAARVVADAAEGLHFAHTLCDEAGRLLSVVHRDISPQNLFITLDGGVKILDFGVARTRSRLVQTQAGVVRGRLAYTAPERVVGQPHDHRVDIFSLGIVLWETTVGKRLFQRGTEALSLRAIVTSDVPRPTDIVEGYPADLEAIALKALDVAPERRHQSCQELQEELEQFLAASGHVVIGHKLGHWVQQLFDDEPQRLDDLLRETGSFGA